MHNLLERERIGFKQAYFAAAVPPTTEQVALPARGAGQHFLWERRGKENHGAEPSKPPIAKPRGAAGHGGEPEPLWPSCSGREGASCHTSIGACHVLQENRLPGCPRANATGGISCRTQGRTKHSPSCFAGVAGSLPG